MVNKLLLLFLIFASLSSYAQINVSFDRDCLLKNSSILSHSFIESVGTDTVTMLLENDIRILMFLNVDSLGRVLNLEKITSKGKISDDLTNKVIDNLIRKDKHFFICFEKPQEKSECEAFKLISKDLFDVNKKMKLINIAFPGDLMLYYSLEKEKKQGLSLSKLEYLQRQIKKYL